MSRPLVESSSRPPGICAQKSKSYPPLLLGKTATKPGGKHIHYHIHLLLAGLKYSPCPILRASLGRQWIILTFANKLHVMPLNPTHAQMS